jgi:hypothetical protein
MEMKMALYWSFLNLITGAPSILDRLTAALKRDGNRRARQILLSQSGQAPPRRLKHGLWRYRVHSVRLNDLSPHLRRDIGLDG